MEEKNIITEQVAEVAGDMVVASKSNDLIKSLGKISGVAVAVVVVGFAIDKIVKAVKSKKDQKNEETVSADEPTVTVDYSEENDAE